MSSLHVDAANLTLTSQPAPVSGIYYCPGPVNFTCVATEISIDSQFFWDLNGSWTFNYGFRVSDVFPFNLTRRFNDPLAGVTAQIIDASLQGGTIFNVESVMRIVMSSPILNSTSVRCSDKFTSSGVLNISVIRK